MILQDPISHLLTRIRNGQKYRHSHVLFPELKKCIPIIDVLYQYGYIIGYNITKSQILIHLKYYKNEPVIKDIYRISKPSKKMYYSCETLKSIQNRGIYILSTTKGVVAHIDAIPMNIGGEAICYIG